MPKYAPTPDEIRRASEHVRYEFSQLTECKRFLLPDPYRSTMDEYGDPIPSVAIYGAVTTYGVGMTGYSHFGASAEEIRYDVYLTAFTVHARNLFAFFFKDRKDGGKNKVGDDDVIVADFFKPGTRWTARIVSGKDQAWFDAIWDRVNKLTAHITYSRVNWTKEKSWFVYEIYEYLSVLWNDFIDKASPERYVP